jgi:hypothetical protein
VSYTPRESFSSRSRRLSLITTHQSHESPRAGRTTDNFARVQGRKWNGVHKPGALCETVNSLLPNEFVGLLIEFRTQISRGKFVTVPLAWTNADQPDGHFAQQVVFLLQLLHLTFPYGLVIGLEEVLFYFVPWPHILLPECNPNPTNL